MFPMIKILHLPQVSFPKYTVSIDGQIVKTANNLDPSELLELIGVPHTYVIRAEVRDEQN